jgi:hypothetical protein
VAESLPDVEFYAVSCVAHNDVCQANNVRSWPSIYTFHKGSDEKVAWKGRGATGFTADAVRAVFGGAVERKVESGESDAVNGESKEDDEVSTTMAGTPLRFDAQNGLDLVLTTLPSHLFVSKGRRCQGKPRHR